MKPDDRQDTEVRRDQNEHRRPREQEVQPSVEWEGDWEEIEPLVDDREFLYDDERWSRDP